MKVPDHQYEEQPEQLTSDDEPDDEEHEKLNSGDEGYPAIEVSVRQIIYCAFANSSAELQARGHGLGKDCVPRSCTSGLQLADGQRMAGRVYETSAHRR